MSVSNGQVAEWLVWLELMISIALGTALGYFLSKIDIVGFIILGAWFGATTTFLFQNIIIRAIVSAALVWKLWEKAKYPGIALGSCLLIIPILFTYVSSNSVSSNINLLLLDYILDKF